jgi:transposase
VRRIGAFDAEFGRWAKEIEDARRLATIPGVGVTISTALIAAVGKAEAFEHGRDLAAWLGWSRVNRRPAANHDS